MTNEQLKNAKTELARKALPHLVDPEGYGPSPLRPGECALLLTKDAAHVKSQSWAETAEKAALAKLGARLRSMGVASVADCLPPRRG